jgi:hypothetical protein
MNHAGILIRATPQNELISKVQPAMIPAINMAAHRRFLGGIPDIRAQSALDE